MAQTYAQLQATVADYLKRDDLTAIIPSLILRAENVLNRRLRNLASMEAVTSFTLASAASTVALTTISATLNKLIRVWRAPTGIKPFEIIYLTPLQMLEQRDQVAGPPDYYTVQGGRTIQFSRTADATYTDLVAHHTTKLVLATAPNWLSTDHEDAYIWASLMQAEPYCKNDKRFTFWAMWLDDVIQDILTVDREQRGAQNEIIIPEITKHVGVRAPFDWRSG